jgi:cytochrome c oxidase subunit I+III
MLAGLYWIAPLFLVGVGVLGWRWAWTNGTREDHGPLPAGTGVALPLSTEATGTTGWWGSVFALAASATLFASLLFGYAFLWTVAPDWPPPQLIARTVLEPALALLGAVLAIVGVRRAGPDGRTALTVAAGGQIALVLALVFLVVLRLPSPASHAYAATGAVVASYAIFHAALATTMLAFARARIGSGHIGGARLGELRIVRLWSDHAAGAGVVATLVLALPGWIA